METVVAGAPGGIGCRLQRRAEGGCACECGRQAYVLLACVAVQSRIRSRRDSRRMLLSRIMWSERVARCGVRFPIDRRPCRRQMRQAAQPAPRQRRSHSTTRGCIPSLLSSPHGLHPLTAEVVPWWAVGSAARSLRLCRSLLAACSLRRSKRPRRHGDLRSQDYTPARLHQRISASYIASEHQSPSAQEPIDAGIFSLLVSLRSPLAPDPLERGPPDMEIDRF